MNKLIPLIVTDDLDANRAFYGETLGWELAIDMDGYLQVRHGSDEADPELAFSTPDLAQPMGSPMSEFTGEGLVVSVPVADADAHHRSLVGKGATATTEPSDKPWGWRSFLITDPNGVRLDFFHTLSAS